VVVGVSGVKRIIRAVRNISIIEPINNVLLKSGEIARVIRVY
jgi:hypothetical protein